MSDELLEMIKAEASELLEELEQALLALEEEPADVDLVNRVFRSVHTVKGSASIYGLQQVQDLGHVVETAFDLVRSGERVVDRALLNATLAAKDMLWDLIDAPDEVDGAGYEAMVGRFEAWIEGRELPAAPEAVSEVTAEPEAAPAQDVVIDDFDDADAAPATEPAPETEAVPGAYIILYRPEPQGALLQADPQGVLDDLRSVGDLQLFVRLDRLPVLEDVDVDACYLWWEMVAVTSEDTDRLRDAFIFVEDRSEVSVQETSDPVRAAAEAHQAAMEAAASWLAETPEVSGGVVPADMMPADMMSADMMPDEDMPDEAAPEAEDTEPVAAAEMVVPDDEAVFAEEFASEPDVAAEMVVPDDDAVVFDEAVSGEAMPDEERSDEAVPEEFVPEEPPAPPTTEADAAEETAAAPPEEAPAPGPGTAEPRPAPEKAPGRTSARAEQDKAEQASSIRVESYKIDDMVDLVGELVIAQARLNQIAGRLADQGLFAVAEDMERLSNNLRDRTLSIRMLPIGTTFDRYRRLVREAAQELGKEVRLHTRGEDTELDKTVIEQLGEPLVHILRNAMEHGIEAPDERLDAGKNPQGTLELAAEHSGGHVLIRVSDDGRGFSRERIEERARERGLINENAQLDDAEVYGLVFHPGFSTPEDGTVGMDVVKEGIDALRGHVELDSEPGKGACVTIKLPLTLAIIEGLEVRVGEEFYILPLTAVEECVENVRNGDEEKSGKKIINLRSEIVPYVRLREWFSVPGAEQHIEQIIITSGDGRRTGIAVDEVVGQQQTVIKSIGSAFEHLDEVSGATVKGDGSMALILDVPTLVRKVRTSVMAQA